MTLSEETLPRVPGHPLLGHLPQLRDDRIRFLHSLLDQPSRLVRLRVGVFPILATSSPALAHDVLVTHAASFVKSPGLAIFARPLLGDGLLTSEHDFHRSQRKRMAPAFAPARIAAYADVMAERAERSAERVLALGEVDLAEEAMRATLDIVGKTLFDAEIAGSASEVGDALTEAMERMMRSMTANVPMPPAIPTSNNRRYRKAIARLDEIVYGLVRGRRDVKEDRRDVLSILLSSRDDDGSTMDDTQVRDEAMTLVLAGHETTAAALTWAMYLLARHPDARARVEEELDRVLGDRAPRYADLASLPYTLAVVKETMRLHPPAYIVARRAIEDVVVGEHLVPKGRVVLVNIAGIHRDPASFVDPGRFDPERFLGANERAIPKHAYLPFGAGARVCIGSQFALAEAHLLLAAWSHRFRVALRDPGVEVEPEPLITLRPKGGLPATVTARTYVSSLAHTPVRESA